MMVTCEGIINFLVPHNFKRGAIGKAPAFIQPLFIKCPSFRPQNRIDKDNFNPGGILKYYGKM